MKTFLLICALLFSLTAFSQQTSKTFVIKEVGWTFTLPPDFESFDSAKIAATNNRGKKIMDSLTDIDTDLSTAKTLFAAATIERNYFDVAITPGGAKTENAYKRRTNYENGMLYKTYAALKGAGLDSASATRKIDGLLFDQFTLKVSKNGKLIFTTVLYSKLYKGVDLTISYISQDVFTKEELETMLSNSKFDK